MLSLAPRMAVGVDIGSHSIKLCQLRERKNSLYLAKFDIALLPPSTVVDGAVMDFEVLAGRLKEMVIDHRLKGWPAAVAISEPHFIVKRLEMPQMSGPELEEMVPYEADQNMPFRVDEMALDFQVLNDNKGQGSMELLVVGGKKNIIADYVAVLTEAGLVPTVVDIDPMALMNALELNYGSNPFEVTLLVNAGNGHTNLVFAQDGLPEFHRHIPLGGMTLTETISEVLNISHEEAEVYKTGDQPASSSSLLTDARKLSDRFIGNLVSEISRSLDFFKATNSLAGGGLDRIFLGGGCSQLPGLAEKLETTLEAPVDMINPFKNIVINPKKIDLALLQRATSVAVVAVGLALRRRRDKS